MKKKISKLTREEEQGFKAGVLSQKEAIKPVIQKAILFLTHHGHTRVANELAELIK